MKRFITLLLIAVFLGTPFMAQAAKPTSSNTFIPNSVCLDPGHGGTDPGAVYYGMNEKDINLAVGLSLRDKLTAAGYTVFMTRTTDVTLSNNDRYTYCNSTNAALVVAIHQNASTNPATDYTEVLYAKHGDKATAQQFANTISVALSLPNNGITNFADGVLIKTNAPAVLTESLFMSASAETTGLQDGTRIDAEASALQLAIQHYFGN